MFKEKLQNFFSLSRRAKILLQITVDLIIIMFCYFFSFYLRLDDTYFLDNKNVILILPFLQLITISVFYKLKFYQNILRYLSLEFVKYIFTASFFSTISIYLISYIFDSFLPKSVPIIYLRSWI